jgi:formylmethanofuran dehydrogenase subunit D
MNMNAFDREFWNSALKASIIIERDLKKLGIRPGDFLVFYEEEGKIMLQKMK